jgi:hypothetical protein
MAKTGLMIEPSSLGFDVKTLIDLEPTLIHLGSSVKNAANWIERLDHLRNAMLPTLPGQSRLFPSIKAKQLILVAALVQSGARPSQADAYAASLILDIKRGVELPEFLVVQSGNFSAASPMEYGELKALRDFFPAVPVTIIPVRAIVALVDNLFKDDV